MFIIIAVFCVGAIFWIYGAIQYTYSKRITSLELAKPQPAALVLGASVKQGEPNRVLQERLDTALALYTSGKVKKLLLSGDNRTIDYNEPEAMKRYLVEKGISEKDLVLDYAGRRTYDSCYRVKEVFHVESLIIVTQDFHLPRALYLCNILGVDAIGVPPYADYPGRWLFWYLREIPATVQAWIDITFRKPRPILGNSEKVF